MPRVVVFLAMLGSTRSQLISGCYHTTVKCHHESPSASKVPQGRSGAMMEPSLCSEKTGEGPDPTSSGEVGPP